MVLGAAVGEDVTRPAALLLLVAGFVLLLAAAGGHRPRLAILVAGLATAAAARGQEARAYETNALLAWSEEAPEEAVRLVGVAAADPRPVGDRWVLLVDVETVDVR